MSAFGRQRGGLLLVGASICLAALAADEREPLRLEIAWPKRAPTSVDMVLRGNDPGFGGWETEVLNADVERRLATLSRWIEDPSRIDLERLPEFLTDDFACERLRPPDLSEAFRDGTLSVRRSTATRTAEQTTESSRVHRGPTGLVTAFGALREGLGSGRNVTVNLETYRIDSTATSFTTRVLLEASNSGSEVGIQQRARWLMGWTRAADSSNDIRLKYIAGIEYEEATVNVDGGALFADHTESAMRTLRVFPQLVQTGMLHWAERIGRIEGVALHGHSGIAIGDADGDGLDDLYVCSEGGLPNRLLLQNPDGTLRDVSAWAGVDWLEPSHAALLVDLDNDGNQDLIVATLPSVLIMQNEGHGKFAMRSRLHVGNGAYAVTGADYDDDGDLDLFLTLYSGRGAHEGESIRSKPQAGGHSGGMAAMTMFDPIDDGLAETEDMPSTELSREGVPPEPDPQSSGNRASGLADETGVPVPYYDANNGSPNILLRNEGRFRFIDVTNRSGLDQNNRRYSFAAAWEDYDNDGDLDVYVANDFGRNNLYRNDGGRFKDVAAEAGVEDVGAGMSVSWGDYDRDGWPDVYVSNMFSSAGSRIVFQTKFAAGHSDEDVALLRRTARGNTLLANNGEGRFLDRSELAGVNEGLWAWSSNFADLNNDGWLDLVVANGFLSGEVPGDLDSFFWRQVVSRSPQDKQELVDYEAGWEAIMRLVHEGASWSGHQRNRAFLNGGSRRFADISAVSGLDFADDGRGVALVDWDLDGDLDLWLRNRTAPRLRLMLNQLPRDPAAPDFVALKLRGTECNSDAIGARVEVELQGRPEDRLIQTLRAGEGFRSQSSKWLHFGLGSNSSIEQITVRWPGGPVERFAGAQPGRRYLLVQGTGEAVEWLQKSRSVTLQAAPTTPVEGAESARVVFSRRPPSPALSYLRSEDSAELPLHTDDRPLLVSLWSSRCDVCINELETLTENEARLRAAGLDVLALSVDELAVAPSSDSREASRILREIGFPFVSGAATVELLEKLELLQRALLGRVPPFAVPLKLLLDREGRLAVIYRGPSGIDQIVDDLSILGLSGEALRNASLPLDGRWYTRFEPVESFVSALVDEFHDYYPNDAISFLESALQYHQAKRRNASLSGREKTRSDTQLADIRFQLAVLLTEQGRREAAVEHYRQVLALQPDRADVLSSQGALLAELGYLEAAVRHFRRSLTLEPDDPNARNNLGLALAVQGRFDEAIREYGRALEADPNLEEAHYNLGVALSFSGRPEQAIEEFRGALRLQPDSVASMNEMAWILATHWDPTVRDPSEAMLLARRAAELTDHRDATILDTLAAAYACASRFDDAVKAAEVALNLATQTQQLELARYLSQRLDLYRRAQPYRERAGSPDVR